MISLLELRRVLTEWRTRLQRVQSILNPPEWSETDWKQFGRALLGLVQRHGATWTVESKTYWDMRWHLRDGGELICQIEAVANERFSVVVAQVGGFIREVESYTWFWAEFDPSREFVRDPYWVEGTWKEALTTLLLPYQYQAGYYLAGSAPTPPSLMLGATNIQSNEEEAGSGCSSPISSLALSSYAKINLTLQILGKRPDGFHEISSLMLPISLHDTMQFERLNDPHIEIECSDSSLPTDRGNLVRRAAELLQSRHAPHQGARIRLQKNIPIGAGLGGGSSNGSTALVGLNRLWNLNLSNETLEQLASEFGSDTAFFVRCRPALSEGRGEILTPVPTDLAFPILLLNFGFGSATAWAYRHLTPKIPLRSPQDRQQFMEDLRASISAHSPIDLQNDLEEPVFHKFPILRIAKHFLLSQPQVIGAMMCGSGSTMMAILKSADQAESLHQAILEKFGKSVWVWNGHTLSSEEHA